MSCKIPNYIDKQPLSKAEKERLSGINTDIFDKVKASGAFRGKDVLLAKKQEFGKATSVVGKINTEYKTKVATLDKVKSTGNTEQFALRVNVLPLSDENQSNLAFSPTPEELQEDYRSLFDGPEVNKYVEKYVPGATVAEPKIALEKALTEEGNVEAKKGIQVLLDNIHKIQVNLIQDHGDQNEYGHYNLDTHEVVLNANTITTSEEARITLVHEMHHAYGIGVLESPLTEKEVDFSRNVGRIFRELKAANPSSKLNGLKDEREFLAELASSKDFRQSLRGTSIWSRIIRAFRKLLGQSDQYDKLLNQYYDVLDSSHELQRNVPGINRISLKPAKTKKQKEIKKQLDVLEKFIATLGQRRTRLYQHGQSKKAQQVSKDIKELEKVLVVDRSIALVKALAITEREMSELDEAFEKLERDPAKINPDVVLNIQVQLTSYEVLKSMANEIRRKPADFVSDPEMAKALVTAIDGLRGRINTMTEDIDDLIDQRYAWVSVQNTSDPNASFEKALDTAKVADRDISWWSRMFESARGVFDSTVSGVFRTINNVYSKAHRENLSEDLWRKEVKSETLQFKTRKGKDWHDNVIDFKSVGIVKATEEFEAWLKKKGLPSSTPADMYSHILNVETLQQNASGVLFISPLSKEGKDMLKIKDDSEDFPLKQFYSTIVLGKLKSEENIKNPSMRGGLRIPSMQRSLLEGILTGKDKFSLFKENLLYSIQKRTDDRDFRAVDENFEPIHYLPVRFTSRHDGQHGRLTTREVSLDLPATVALYMAEMRTREGMQEVVSDLEITKTVLGQREVVKSSGRLPGLAGLLTGARRSLSDPQSGKIETIAGTESNSYKLVDSMMRRLVYGEFKEPAGSFEAFGRKIDVRKGLTQLLKWTGFNIMFMNLAIPLTNIIVGKTTMFKEAIGGNLVDFSDLAAAEKMYLDAAQAAFQDIGEREKKSVYGRLYMIFNPLGEQRPANHLGINKNWMTTTFGHIFSSGAGLTQYKISSEAIGSALHRFKVQDAEGKDVPMYNGTFQIEADMNGKLQLKPGYKYKGKSTIDGADIDEIRDYIGRVYELVYGNYARLTSPGAMEYWWGEALFLMRKWLPEGIAARWKTRYYDESLHQDFEGHYVSALATFNGIWTRGEGVASRTLDSLRMLTFMNSSNPDLLLLPNELNLSREEKDGIIKLRQAGIRKTMVDLYMISALTLAVLALSGGDDDDSYVKYMAIRIRRELLTFIDPSNAWDVLRSPSVLMNNINGMHKIIWDVGSQGWANMTGDDAPVYKSGAYKGENKLWADIQRQIGMHSLLHQFDDLEKKSRLMTGGGWR